MSRLAYGAELNFFAASSLNNADTRRLASLKWSVRCKRHCRRDRQTQQSGIQDQDTSMVTSGG